MSDEEPKVVLIIRRDLKLRRGKEIAQGCHTSVLLAAYYEKYINNCATYFKWRNGIHKTIVLQAEGLPDLVQIAAKAAKLGVCSNYVTDIGLTELETATITALFLGPDYNEKLDQITSNLKLY